MLQEQNARSGFFEPDQFREVLANLPAPLQPVVEFAYITGWVNVGTDHYTAGFAG